MASERVSILSTIVNAILATLKLVVGLAVNSAALVAEGIHSGLDILSSLISFFGIRSSQKPVDEKHPYGHYRKESLAGFLITFLLFGSGLWIIYEAVIHFLKQEPVVFSFWAVGLMLFSVLINETMARLKFHYGQKYETLSLIADAEHSRADVLSSAGVLLGLVLSKYFLEADAIIAGLIGFYILFRSFSLGRQQTDSLLDVSNKSLEERIRQICKERNIYLSSLKTRKIGAANFAEVKVKLDKSLRVDEATSITKQLETELLDKIAELKYVVIAVESHQFKESTVVPRFGKGYGFRSGITLIGPEKRGKRLVIPIEDSEISKDHFGTKRYLLIDVGGDNKILRKEILENPYYTEEKGHGLMFAKSVSADKVMTKHLGIRAK